MKVCIVGAGAVGLGIASCLLSAGVEVRLVVRDRERRHSLARDGIFRSGIFGENRFGPDAFTLIDDLEALGGPPDCQDDAWLICVKSTASRVLAKHLGVLWQGGPYARSVVLFQNGWGNAEILADALPKEKIFSARVITGFRLRSPSHVEITVHADSIRIGSLFDANTDAIQPLVQAIDRGGIPCETSREIARDLWAKLLYNTLLNPLGALLRVPYGELARHPQTRALMAGLAREVFEVLEASGYRTHWQTSEDYLETFYRDLLPATQSHESSMLQDLRAGRQTEIDSLCGALCELAARHRVSVPLNESLAELIRGAQQTAAARFES